MTCPEALQCVGVLSFALEHSWEHLVSQLLETMMLTGLSEVLVEALTQVLIGEGRRVEALIPAS